MSGLKGLLLAGGLLTIVCFMMMTGGSGRLVGNSTQDEIDASKEAILRMEGQIELISFRIEGLQTEREQLLAELAENQKAIASAEELIEKADGLLADIWNEQDRLDQLRDSYQKRKLAGYANLVGEKFDNLVLANGKTLGEAEVTAATSERIKVRTEMGGSTFSSEDMPPEWISKIGGNRELERELENATGLAVSDADFEEIMAEDGVYADSKLQALSPMDRARFATFFRMRKILSSLSQMQTVQQEALGKTARAVYGSDAALRAARLGKPILRPAGEDRAKNAMAGQDALTAKLADLAKELEANEARMKLIVTGGEDGEE